MIDSPDIGGGNDAAPEFSIAVFAHNEEDSIDRCLDSILTAAAQVGRVAVHVLNNGSRDGTSDRVRAWQARDSRVDLIEIKIGDKANAWNVFVHEICPKAAYYAFVDGDVTISSDALFALRASLLASPDALISTGVPHAGRNLGQQFKSLEHGGVMGNLYAARSSFIENIRQAGIRMPIGFIREDGLVGGFACYALDPVGDIWDTSRVAVAKNAEFIFPSLSFARIDDWRLYWRRRIRYSTGHFQFVMLRRDLKSVGFRHMPAHVADLYAQKDLPPLCWRGLDTLFDWIALRRIRAERICGHPAGV